MNLSNSLITGWDSQSHSQILLSLEIIRSYFTYPMCRPLPSDAGVVSVKMRQETVTDIPTSHINPLVRLIKPVDTHLVGVQCFNICPVEKPWVLLQERHCSLSFQLFQPKEKPRQLTAGHCGSECESVYSECCRRNPRLPLRPSKLAASTALRFQLWP